MSQKIVIPRGTVNPNETTVVDIPNSLRGSAVVVAKKRPGSPSDPWSSTMQSGGGRSTNGPRLRAGAPQEQRTLCPSYGGSFSQSQASRTPESQMRDLDRIDIVEQNQLTDDLRDFQEMRRKLVQDVSNIAGASPTAHRELPKSVFNTKRIEKMTQRHH